MSCCSADLLAGRNALMHACIRGKCDLVRLVLTVSQSLLALLFILLLRPIT